MREILRRSFVLFSERGCRTLAGAVSFYALLSIAPILLFAVEVASALAGEDRATEGLGESLRTWVGPAGAGTLLDLLERSREASRHGGLLGLVLLAYAATRLFSHVRHALHHVWGVDERKVDGLVRRVGAYLERRAASFLLVLSVGLLLVAIVVAKIVVVAVSERVGIAWGWSIVEPVLAVGLSALLFFAIFRFLPDAGPPVRSRASGALVTAVLFASGALAVGAYVGRKGADSVWGAATSLVMLLLWVHYSAQIFLFGVAATRAFAERAAPSPRLDLPARPPGEEMPM
jgi:membrane protein